MFKGLGFILLDFIIPENTEYFSVPPPYPCRVHLRFVLICRFSPGRTLLRSVALLENHTVCKSERIPQQLPSN